MDSNGKQDRFSYFLKVATVTSLNEALMITLLRDLLIRDWSKTSTEYEQRIWIKVNADTWQRMVPFWQVNSAKVYALKLNERGLIETTRILNEDITDKGLWYSVSWDLLNEMLES